MLKFRKWLKLQEDGGGFGNPGTPFPDGQKPSDNGINKTCNPQSGAPGPCTAGTGASAAPGIGPAPGPMGGPPKKQKKK